MAMNAPSLAGRGAILSRLRGARIGAMIGAGWAAYGLSLLPSWAMLVGAVAVVAILLVLLRFGSGVSRQARALPSSPGQGAGKRFFWGLLGSLAFEIVLLNLAAWALSAPPLRIYLIAAISAAVGVHFFPMAVIFRMPSFWLCGAAMIVGAALAALAFAGGLPAVPVTAAEALLNAVILWLTAAQGMDEARRTMTFSGT
jgi:hypothetical protein